jgi:Glycosyltransferase family 87
MSVEVPSLSRYRQFSWWSWLALTGVVTFTVVMSIVMGQERSVTPSYQSAVVNWFAGEPLYSMEGHGFLYLPQAALTFAPWAMLPHTPSELVWRWCMIGVLGASCLRLTRLVGGDDRWFFAISLSSVVLAWGCARNGQSTLLITGLMILAAADLSEARWWRATILLSLAFAFKPLAIVMILLAAAVYPRISWRLAIGLLFVAVVPFMTQRPDYVISQYRACVQNLEITFEVGETGLWAQFFGMLQVAGIEFPSAARTAIRLLAAATTLFACWKASRVLSPERGAFYLFSFASCYLMLFNSRTEGNTYTMIGPVYGALLAEAAFQLKNRTSTAWLIAAVVLTVANYELAVLVTPRPKAIWISPLVCVGVTGYLILRLVQEIRAVRLRDQMTNEENLSSSRLTREKAAA